MLMMWTRRTCRLVVATAALLATGCVGNDSTHHSAPGLKVSSLDILELQDEVTNLAEDHLIRLARATEIRSDRDYTLEQRRFLQSFRLVTADATITNVTEQNPIVAMIDTAVMVRLQHEMLEREGRTVLGTHVTPLLDVYRASERNMRGLLDRVLEPSMVAQVDDLVDEWRRENPDQVEVSHVRLAFLAGRRQRAPGGGADTAGPRSIFGFLYLDPLAGIDPAIRELEQSRQLAERAFYQARRTAMVAGWILESEGTKLLGTPEFRNLTENADRAVAAAERGAALAESVPDRLAAERDTTLRELEGMIERQRADALAEVEATFVRQRDESIAGIHAAVATEREALVRLLEEAEAPVRDTARDLRETIAAAGALSTDLRGLVADVDGLVRTVGLDQPRSADGEGIDPDAYRALSVEAGRAARDLTGLVTATDRLISSPDLAASTDRLEATGHDVVDRLFRRGLVLVAAFGLALFLALTASRLVVHRLAGRPAA